MRQSLEGKSIFELGCGTGAVGLFAAALGAADVTLTDGGGAGVLDVARQNMESNRALTTNTQRIRVLEHRWGESLSALLPRRLDLVLASDCTYARRTHAALCTSVRSLIESSADAPPPRVIIAHQRRTFFASGDGHDDLEHFRKVAAQAGLKVASLELSGSRTSLSAALRHEVTLLDVTLATSE